LRAAKSGAGEYGPRALGFLIRIFKTTHGVRGAGFNGWSFSLVFKAVLRVDFASGIGATSFFVCLLCNEGKKSLPVGEEDG
jgi:hypothetical protein